MELTAEGFGHIWARVEDTGFRFEGSEFRDEGSGFFGLPG